MMQAKRARGWVVLGALAVSQWACTSMRPVGSLGVGASDTIEPGDRVSVVDTRGATTELVVTGIGENFIAVLSLLLFGEALSGARTMGAMQ